MGAWRSRSSIDAVCRRELGTDNRCLLQNYSVISRNNPLTSLERAKGIEPSTLSLGTLFGRDGIGSLGTLLDGIFSM
jgi:hypothetical protein